MNTPTDAQIAAAIIAYGKALGNGVMPTTTADHLQALIAAVTAALNTEENDNVRCDPIR